jgi:cell division protein FtsQ
MLMPSNTKCNAYLPVATGNINKSFATKELHNFALFLQQDRFWNSQIEQIHVLNNQTVELVPRVGSHTIYLGKLTQVENKLERVKQFYKKALNQVGWNKYSRINVEFGNQIVCTKANNSK